MIEITLHIFFISFLINLVWEVLHSQLYTTCLEMPFKKYPSLIVKQSIKDGLWISTFYLITYFLFQSAEILTNKPQLIAFITLALAFSFIDEKVSINLKRWEYSKQMPTIFGVGLTPLLELAVTGVITFLYVFLT
ncbi:hypothetical protein HOD30_02570 [Candidatus Peregrinibacteria bacterium]|jgi:hypothetical protein|nr:hypothetical protein [Candidatus Peregrinibacteria bacterium]MBT4631552.1 hypothetical protein [Candidatus Peregrinibacteria bacterium]MBT5823537.1 hypothetical protein [Candidatus Peregrinibacteria bacterium]